MFSIRINVSYSYVSHIEQQWNITKCYSDRSTYMQYVGNCIVAIQNWSDPTRDPLSVFYPGVTLPEIF